jgi:hypothetical protein
MEKLAKGDWAISSDEARTAVAAYFSLVSMMWQLVDRHTMSVTQTERTHIMQTQTPPPNWRVFVAEHNAPEWHEKLMHTGFGIYFGALMAGGHFPEQPNCHSLVSTFGKIAFSTLSMSGDASNILDTLASVYVREFGLQTIWPVDGAAISKPVRSLLGADLFAMGNYFYPVR